MDLDLSHVPPPPPSPDPLPGADADTASMYMAIFDDLWFAFQGAGDGDLVKQPKKNIKYCGKNATKIRSAKVRQVGVAHKKGNNMQLAQVVEKAVLGHLGLGSKVWTVSHVASGVLVIGKRQNLLNRRARLVSYMRFLDVNVGK